MDRRASTTQGCLEQMLHDETAEPKALPFSLLEDITGDFANDRQIGSGGFAVVYKGILGDRAVAVKRLSNVFMHEPEFHREVECLMQVKHKNVVRFLGYCADRQGSMERYNGKYVMADVHQRLLCFEYISKGSLDKYIIDANREWGTCYKIIKGICEGLQYIHENRIVHLDLKPTNILLDDNMVPKITDFGLSRCFDENQSRHITKNILGTIGYLAPEFGEGGVIARSTDLYSLGVIILEILTGHKGYKSIEDVLESWSDRLQRSQGDTQCEQIRVCYKTALECREFDPKKRPASVRHVIDRLHKMESIEATAAAGTGMDAASCPDHHEAALVAKQAVVTTVKSVSRGDPACFHFIDQTFFRKPAPMTLLPQRPSSPATEAPMRRSPFPAYSHAVLPRWNRFDAREVFPEPAKRVDPGTGQAEIALYGEIERRLRKRGVSEPARDLDTLKQILEALKLKGLLQDTAPPPPISSVRNPSVARTSPTRRLTTRRQSVAAPPVPPPPGTSRSHDGQRPARELRDRGTGGREGARPPLTIRSCLEDNQPDL